MSFLRKAFNSTVGVIVRAPVAAIKVVDNLTDVDSDLGDDIGDTIDYLATGKSEQRGYDGVADFNKKGR